MTSAKYIGMDVHTESISIAVRNSLGKIVMECVIEAEASSIVQFIDGLRGDLRVTFEEGTWGASSYRRRSSSNSLFRVVSGGVRRFEWVQDSRVIEETVRLHDLFSDSAEAF